MYRLQSIQVYIGDVDFFSKNMKILATPPSLDKS